jgi:hypothetical protein
MNALMRCLWQTICYHLVLQTMSAKGELHGQSHEIPCNHDLTIFIILAQIISDPHPSSHFFLGGDKPLFRSKNPETHASSCALRPLKLLILNRLDIKNTIDN